VIFDSAPFGKSFGAVLVDVNTTAYHAGDTVSAQFVGANPRVRLPRLFMFSSEKEADFNNIEEQPPAGGHVLDS
jgi:neutral ceramidase